MNKIIASMSKDYLLNAIERLESIDPLSEFAYEDAISAFLNMKGLPVLFFEITAVKGFAEQGPMKT